MSDKPLTDKEKQFTVLSNEADPNTSLPKANRAISKALSEIKKSQKGRPVKPLK